MRHSIFLYIFIFLTFNCFSSTEHLLWPISGCEIGENILSQPEDLIDDEVNKTSLFIGGELHSLVLAPSDGVITFITYMQMISLKRSASYKLYCPRTGKTSTRDSFPEDVYIAVGIKAENGVKYWISGLDSIENFVTGQRISKGDKLGKMGYAYSKIYKPHICFSKSVNSKSADPMSPFGLESSYVPDVPDETDYSTYKHSVEAINMDFKIFRNALEEGHSGLCDFCSKEDMDSMFVKVQAKLNKPMTTQEVLNTIRPIIRNIRDSHTSIKTYKKINNNCQLSKTWFSSSVVLPPE